MTRIDTLLAEASENVNLVQAVEHDPHLARAAEDLDLVELALRDVLRRLRDQMAGQLGAQRYDAPQVHGHTTVVDEWGRSMPSVSDPTGEAAVRAASGGDGATNTQRHLARLIVQAHRDAALLLELDPGGDRRRLIGRIARTADRMVAIVRVVQRRGPTSTERSDTAAVAEPGCKSCARLVVDGQHWWQLIHRGDLCQWCLVHLGDDGALPSLGDVRLHHDGKPVRRRVRQIDRLRAGLTAGRL